MMSRALTTRRIRHAVAASRFSQNSNIHINNLNTCKMMSTAAASNEAPEPFRVAIVGGGVAGLSSALHLAPLVASGHIQGPIDVYDGDAATDTSTSTTTSPDTTTTPTTASDTYSNNGREIGVGIWSTALDPFAVSTEESHQLLLRELNHHGSYLRDVGYRTPNGEWLAKSRLGADSNMPDLLFIREMDLLESLHKAVEVEAARGAIRVHFHSNVSAIVEDSPKLWSAPLQLGGHDTNNTDDDDDGKNRNNNTNHPSTTTTVTVTDRDYHLIVAADGMNSTIRQLYGGHVCERSRLTGTAALEGPLGLPHNHNNNSNNDIDDEEVEFVTENWHTTGQKMATSTQDRNYTVFRGNADVTGHDNVDLARSFQTWGEGQSMRFATVPMFFPDPNNSNDDGSRQERDVWFITIDKEEIISEADPVKRKELLLQEFQDWHEPIRTLVKATPPEEILMERALAHRHSMSPVANFAEIVTRIRSNDDDDDDDDDDGYDEDDDGEYFIPPPPSRGNGPAVVFLGDAFMCVDPILAQGFTFGMEGAAALKTSLEASLVDPTPDSQQPHPFSSSLAFDPILLRQELKERHDNRLHRLICLLRATEMVQALGQPMTGTMAGFISRDVIRPLMKWTPDMIKTPIFNAVAKYSLGLPQSYSGSPPMQQQQDE